MKGKNIVITGGNDGIGFYTCLALAHLEANIIMVCRDQVKAELAVKKIQLATGNQNIHFVIGDLSKRKSVHQAATEISILAPRVDVLINNAGAVFNNFSKSEDGYEMTIATNHLGHFLLTGLLLENLKNAKTARIINVSSNSHFRGKIQTESFTSPCNYSLMSAYDQSKLANVLFTIELAKRLEKTAITVNCLHPGKVRTNMGKKALNGSFLTNLLIKLMSLFQALFGISPSEGAKTSIFLATSPDVNGLTGNYFSKCKVHNTHTAAQNTFLRQELWQISEKLANFHFPSLTH
jgi:NAD(P)-dependent dehydrogenase (short-subunit alcohol dehydrogenase family)